MAQNSSETVTLASALIDSLASQSLTPCFAKLYSQYTRLREHQPGISGWTSDEAEGRLNDVMRLIEAAFVHKEVRDERFRSGMRRAGELLEWLSLPELNPHQLPIRLLAAAAYQLAGYPARSLGLLQEDTTTGVESGILRSLLQADFPGLYQGLTKYWATKGTSNTLVETNTSVQFQHLIVAETASSLGILCAEMRWGNESRLAKAIAKLETVGKVLVHGTDPYSWMLAKLCAKVATVYVESSMRQHLQPLSRDANPIGQEVFERYLRRNYQTGKALAWQSQVIGIERLADSSASFALCTPTGSGKTTVAEIAILQSLFLTPRDQSATEPLIIYLVPTKALATEVEAKLSRVMRYATNRQVTVTALYGGTDWGPTDVWLTATEATVLICTYEKAEALMKFLGPLFLRRVPLVVIDEAHTVEFDGDKDSLQQAENRNLRLEALGARLFTYIEQNHSRVIALSAVASQGEEALASWVASEAQMSAAITDYRSTRQLIGRLECLPDRGFEIRYDLLDGAFLQSPEGDDTPFLVAPFPNYPPAGALETDSPRKRLRPYLFWAAMHLAAPNASGQQHAVLISIAQQIGGYAEDFLQLLTIWQNVPKPVFFQPPVDERKDIWESCLRCCEDYFGATSREYQLLQKGVVVHHGKMPGLLARLLVDVIDKRIVHLVIATSTLSEGVNLPFETILIPSLQRWDGDITKSEFANLVGRAGRPGFGTEGRSLVLLSNDFTEESVIKTRAQYFDLIESLQQPNETNNAHSPLAELLLHLEAQWSLLTNSENRSGFLKWLEQTAPLNFRNPSEQTLATIETLDTLDSILLAAIVELEQISNRRLNPDELEEQLQQIWQRSYAHYANQEQARLDEFFVSRGRALKTTIYPSSTERRRLYRTSLPPRSGNQLLNVYPELRQHLATGENYVTWSSEERFNYIQTVVSSLHTVEKFTLAQGGKNESWQSILRWWLDPRHAVKPTKTQVSKWHDYVSQNFGYKFNWGLGSLIALEINTTFGGQVLEPSLDDWSRTGLPWIVFWIKELIIWGTLDPVAAFLLARRVAITRPDAEALAQQYYQSVSEQSPNEQLNAVTIKNWVQQVFARASVVSHLTPNSEISVILLRDFSRVPAQQWRVLPVAVGDEIQWFDPAGFCLASCPSPANWQAEYLNRYDFMLEPENQVVLSRLYV